ncbi:MAG: hypothetical protein ACREJT_05335, partial [Myxococcota bacterium]
LHGARSTDVKIGPAGLTPGQLQLEVMGFADLYSDAISQAMEDSWTSGMPTQTRARMLELNLGGLEAAMRIAASPNPFTGLLDMTVMVSLQKLVWEEYWVPEVFQEQGYDMLAALEMLEREAWKIADDALSPDQVQAVRDMVVEVRKRYPHQVFVANLRASEIAADRAQSQLDVAGEGSFLSLFALDPLASLTPATRELAQTRLFAERAFFYASRMPILIRWEALLLIDNAVSLPEARSAMESIDRTSRALEQGAQVAQDLETQLPVEREAAINQIADRVTQQREAMISQVFSGITAERQSILAALDDEQLRLRGTLTDLRSTVEATSQLSNSLQTTIHSAKKLVGTLQGEPSADSTARPFDINEYRDVADSTADAVRELNKGLTSVQDLLASPAWSQRESQLKAVGVEGGALLHAAIDQLFWRALLVVALATAGLFVALAAARLVPSKPRSVS